MPYRIHQANVESTHRSGNSAWKAWQEFTKASGIPEDRGTPYTICAFLSWMFDQRHVSKSLSPFHKATKEWRFSCDTAERYISAVVRKFKQCGAKDLDLTEVWAYRQIKKGWKRSRPPSLKAARRPITIDILAAMLPDFDMSDEFDRMAWMSITTAQNGLFRLGELLRASKQNIFPRRAHLRFVSTEHVQLKLMRRKNAPPGQAVLVDYFCNGTPHSAVKATRNALGLPDNFTGIVAGGDLAIFRSNGAEIFKPAIIKRLQRALKRAGFDPDLHSGHSLRKGGAQDLFDAGIELRNISCAGGWAKGSTSLRLYRNVTPAARAGWSKRTAHGSHTGPRVEFNVLDFDQVKVAGSS